MSKVIMPSQEYEGYTEGTMKITIPAIVPPGWSGVVRTRAWILPVFAEHVRARQEYHTGETYCLCPDTSIPEEYWIDVALVAEVEDDGGFTPGRFYVNAEIRGWYCANRLPVPVEMLEASDRFVCEALRDALYTMHRLTYDDRVEMDRRRG